jgi:hypothetical protein
MPASKFDETLILDSKPPVFTDPDSRSGIRHGPCAMGDVAPGDSLTSIHVLLVQHADASVRTATGISDRLTRADNLAGPGRWVVNTELEKGSEPFLVGKPALAMAMAIAEHDDGGTEIDRWSQAVMIVASSG